MNGRHPMAELRQAFEEEERGARLKLAERWCAAWLTSAKATIHNRPSPLFVKGAMPSEQEQHERTSALQRLSIEIAIHCAVQAVGKEPGTTDLVVVAFRSEPHV